MTVMGWIVMVLAVGGITGLLVWCVHKVISTPGASEHVHGPVDIDTHDKDT